jgi:hypothetical protein
MALTTNALIKLRHDTSANYEAADRTYEAGELLLESDQRRIKVGDGSTSYNSLRYTVPDSELCELKYIATDFPGAETPSDMWKFCDGSVISDSDSPLNGKRAYNLCGGDVVLTLTWTADGGGSYATIASDDRFGVAESDWLSGTGVDTGAIVTSYDRDTGEIIISQTDLSGSVSTTFTNDGEYLGGGSNDKITAGDQMQGHWHEMHDNADQYTTSDGDVGILGTSGGGDKGLRAATTFSTSAYTPMRCEIPRNDGTNGEPRTGTRTRPHTQFMPVYMRIK